MDFEQRTGFSYEDFGDLPLTNMQEILATLEREYLIEWLCWNDRNGVYRDEDSLREFNNVMSHEEGVEIILRQTEDSRLEENVPGRFTSMAEDLEKVHPLHIPGYKSRG